MANSEFKIAEPKHLKLKNIKNIDDVKIKCPLCGAGARDLKKIIDKSKVLYYISLVPRYARKYVCKKYGYEF